MRKIPMAIRLLKPSDHNFIYSSWLNSYKRSTSHHLGFHLFCDNHKKIIESLLDRGDGFVACDEEDPDHLYGYIIFEKKHDPGFQRGTAVAHYCLVKKNFQGFGIGSKLWEAMLEAARHFTGVPVMATHATDDGISLKKVHNWIFNPYLLMEIKK